MYHKITSLNSTNTFVGHFCCRGHFAAEAHLLHYSFTSDAIAYVAILLEQSADQLPFTNNSFLDGLWNSRLVADIASESAIHHDRVINPYEDLFPGTYSHFNYVGSLTTPPCTPGAKWFIFDTPVPISADDVRIIRESIGTVPDSKRSQDGNTNRPVQAKNNRPLYYTYGINSNSGVSIAQQSCDGDDADLAKLLSIIAMGVSALCLVLLVIGLTYRVRGNGSEDTAGRADVKAQSEIVSPPVIPVNTVNNNPLFDNRPPSKDSVL